MTLRPGQSYPMHRHLRPYLSIMLEPATVILTGTDGRTERLRLKRGDFVYRARPEQHAVENVGRTRFRNRLVEWLR